MKLLGLNSPEIFIILVIFLSILGPKRIEKSFLLFKKLLKFLLSEDENQTLANPKVKSEEAEESEVKGEIVEPEVKSEEAEEVKVKGEIVEPEVKLEEAEEVKVKEEKVEAEVKVEEEEESEVKEEKTVPVVKSIKPKKRTVKDEIIDVEVNSNN